MTYKEFGEVLKEEKELYLGSSPKVIRQMKKSHHKRYTIWKYMYFFRCCQYWREVRSSRDCSGMQRRAAKLRYRYYDRMRNIYSEKAGVEIGIECRIGRCCDIWHSGVVINGNIGDHCLFHGNNVIGNKGKGHEHEVPDLGNHVDIGAGAVVIGSVRIADDCIIGAGAVVTRSFTEAGSVLTGVPAVKRK